MKKFSLLGLTFLFFIFQSCSNDSDDASKPIKMPKPMVIVDTDAALFVATATHAALYEITIDKLAVKKGQDKRVKNFGNIMAKEHVKALTKLTDIAEGKKIPVPTTMTAEQQGEIDRLLKYDGKDFDRAYMDAMAKNHEDVIKLFTDASKQLMDPDLRSIASKNIGNLKRHLDVVNMIRESIK